MPQMKLTPPNTPITIRKPTRGSERCGVIVASKMVGSSSGVGHGAARCALVYQKNGEKVRPQALSQTSQRQGCGKDEAQGQAGKVKPAPKRAKADLTAALGDVPPMPNADIEEAFRRFAHANPAPKTELQYVNPFTLLVAVVLSAQATDAGVNKATPALFALADTPAKMAALGEDRVRDLIKTIGLYRTKAKNVVELSRRLVAEHGGEVPRTREALEALPGVGRKTANVVLNVAFGEPTIAVDTHIFRVGNRTGMATGKTPLEVEMKLEAVVPANYKSQRASLAYSARALHLPGAQAAVRKVHHRRPVQMAGQNGHAIKRCREAAYGRFGRCKGKRVDRAIAVATGGLPPKAAPHGSRPASASPAVSGTTRRRPRSSGARAPASSPSCRESRSARLRSSRRPQQFKQAAATRVSNFSPVMPRRSTAS